MAKSPFKVSTVAGQMPDARGNEPAFKPAPPSDQGGRGLSVSVERPSAAPERQVVDLEREIPRDPIRTFPEEKAGYSPMRTKSG